MLKFECSAQNRKELVTSLKELTGLNSRYAGAPSFVYVVGPYTVARDGTLSIEETEADRAVLSSLLDAGMISGELPATAEETAPAEEHLGSEISIPINGHTGFFALPPHSGLERAGSKVSVAIKRALAQEPSAAWWIDHQAALTPPFFSGGAVQRLSEFLKLQINEDEDAFWKDIQSRMEKMSSAEIVRFFLYAHEGKEDGRKPEIFDAEAQNRIAEEARRTLRPSEPKSDLLWRVEETEDDICLVTPERNDEVAALARRLGFAWQDGCWRRKKPGTDDMAVEIACRLLTMGLSVRLPRAELVPRVAKADYEPYATKMVIRSSQNNFILKWAWEDGSFYDVLKRIPGTRWDSDHRWAVVPGDRYNEILDFAEANGFKVSEDARHLADEAEAIYRASLVMDVKETHPRREKPPETGCIDEELRDED